MTPRLAILLGLGAALGLGLGTLGGLGLGHVPLLRPDRMQAAEWERPDVSPDGHQRAATRMVAFTGSPHLPQLAWQVDLTDMHTGEHLVLELPGPPGEVSWEEGHVLVVRRAGVGLAVEWSGQ